MPDRAAMPDSVSPRLIVCRVGVRAVVVRVVLVDDVRRAVVDRETGVLVGVERVRLLLPRERDEAAAAALFAISRDRDEERDDDDLLGEER